MNKNIEEGYYWVYVNPILEMGWRVGYFNGRGWYLMNMEGLQYWDLIDNVGDKIENPHEIENFG